MKLEKMGSSDILAAVKNVRLPLYLAKVDITQRYRRSSLGPFWITISTAIMVGCIGFIFGTIFKTPMKDFLPFIATGLILWSLISSTIVEATGVFPASESIIKQLPLPLFTHVIRMVVRNIYIFLHNCILIPLLLLILERPISLKVLLFIPGFALLILNLLWISLLLAVICTRFRDITQIVNSFLQIFFYITPIIWMPEQIINRAGSTLLNLNPFFHAMQLVRGPILNTYATSTNWIVSISICLLGWFLTIVVFNKCKRHVAYWL